MDNPKKNSNILYIYSMALYKLGKHDQALEVYNRAVEQNATNKLRQEAIAVLNLSDKIIESGK